MKKFLLLVVLLSLLLAACGPQSEQGAQDTPKVTSVYIAKGLARIVDAEAGVVCWIYAGRGLSCMPLSDTLLETGH